MQGMPRACPCNHSGANLRASSPYKDSTYGSTLDISTFSSPFLTALGSPGAEDGIFAFSEPTRSKAR